jgi:hypothetical protein
VQPVPPEAVAGLPNRITCAGLASGSESMRSSASSQAGSTSPVSGYEPLVVVMVDELD